MEAATAMGKVSMTMEEVVAPLREYGRLEEGHHGLGEAGEGSGFSAVPSAVTAF